MESCLGWRGDIVIHPCNVSKMHASPVLRMTIEIQGQADRA